MSALYAIIISHPTDVIPIGSVRVFPLLQQTGDLKVQK